MAIVPPLLDDRTWKDLRDEALARVPIYAPEWTDLRPGDPGVALVEVFAYLTEALVYRLNRVPDNTYLAFLNLLDASPRPAEAARGLVQLGVRTGAARAPEVPRETTVSAGNVKFSLLDSLSVLPVELAAYVKAPYPGGAAPPSDSDEGAYAEAALAAYQAAHAGQSLSSTYFVSRAYPPADGSALSLASTVDGVLWIAILVRAADATDPVKLAAALADVRRAIGGQTLSIGVAPIADGGEASTYRAVPDDLAGNVSAAGTSTSPWRWEITAPVGLQVGGVRYPTALGFDQEPTYGHVRLLGDTTDQLRRPGVIKLRLPAADKLFTWDAVQPTRDGQPVGLIDLPRAGDVPPLLDDGAVEKRVIAWLRAVPRRAADGSDPGARVPQSLGWLGPNAVDVVQAIRVRNETLATAGSGQPGQQFTLAHAPVVAGSVELAVLEDGIPVTWVEAESFDAADERASVFLLDRALGVITCGDGLKGRVVPDGARLTASYAYGGGLVGNLPPGAITRFGGNPPDGLDPAQTLNPLSTFGGSETETVDQARRRIPTTLRHRGRAVCADDFRELATLTPGVSVGRVEVLPLYRVDHPEQDFPGVVSVLVVPAEDPVHPRSPRPDRNMRETVCRQLDAHRLITTEIYVIGPTYVPIAVSVGVHVKTGVGVEDVAKWINLALRQYLAPLPPFGPDGAGWPLGGRVDHGAIEAAVLQVDGVAWVEGLELFQIAADGTPTEVTDYLDLTRIQLPELVDVQVDIGAPPPLQPLPSTSGSVAVPVPVRRGPC
jgi:hypothetical protein